MAKTAYYAAKKIETALFHTPDGKKRLTVTLSEGKGKFNLKASMKELREDAPEAQTGMRESFDALEKGKKAFAKVTKEVKAAGWNPIASRVRNAFTEIPLVGEAKKAAKSKIGTGVVDSPEHDTEMEALTSPEK